MVIATGSTALPAKSRGDSFAEDRLRAMLKCNGIADQVQRVHCYDDAARQALAANAEAKPAKTPKQARADKPAPALPRAVQPATTVSAAAADKNTFGQDSLEASHRAKEDRPAVRDVMTAHLVSRSDRGAGLWRFMFDTGTSWEMTETTPFDLPRAGDAITIRRGKLGGYLMDIGSRSAVRVVRVR
jgi:hypothetical protein